MSHSFTQNCCWITLCKFRIIKDERRVNNGRKTNFSKRPKQFDGLTWLTLTGTPVTTCLRTPLTAKQQDWRKRRLSPVPDAFSPVVLFSPFSPSFSIPSQILPQRQGNDACVAARQCADHSAERAVSEYAIWVGGRRQTYELAYTNPHRALLHSHLSIRETIALIGSTHGASVFCGHAAIRTGDKARSLPVYDRRLSASGPQVAACSLLRADRSLS